MPPKASIKPTKAAQVIGGAVNKVKQYSPLPEWLNNAILPDPTTAPDASTFDVSGGLEPAVGAGIHSLAALTSQYGNKFDREMATQRFLDSVKQFAVKHMGGENNQWTQAAESLTQARPRVAAHMIHAVDPDMGKSLLSTSGDFTAAMNWHPLLRRQGPGVLEVSHSAIDDLANNAGHAHNAMFHEANHAAQALGDPKSGMMYDLAHQQVGYTKNPYEITSVVSGGVGERGLKARSAAPIHPHLAQEQIIQHLKDKGIALDTGYSPTGQSFKLRKWGMPAEPENYIERSALDSITQRKLNALEQIFKGAQRDVTPMTRTKGFMTAPKAMDPILEKGMVNQPNLEGALLYLKHRRGEIDTNELERRVADLQRRLGQKP